MGGEVTERRVRVQCGWCEPQGNAVGSHHTGGLGKLGLGKLGFGVICGSPSVTHWLSRIWGLAGLCDWEKK